MSNRATAAHIEFYMGTTPSKWTLYKTAIAQIGAVGIRRGDVVAIQHYGFHDGCHWFMVTATQRGPIKPACYPDHHLSDFVL